MSDHRDEIRDRMRRLAALESYPPRIQELLRAGGEAGLLPEEEAQGVDELLADLPFERDDAIDWGRMRSARAWSLGDSDYYSAPSRLLERLALAGERVFVVWDNAAVRPFWIKRELLVKELEEFASWSHTLWFIGSRCDWIVEYGQASLGWAPLGGPLE